MPREEIGLHEEDDAVSIGPIITSGAAGLLREPRAQAAVTDRALCNFCR